MPASEALSLGLVNRVVPPAQLTERGRALVDELSALEPGALRLMKRYNLALAAGTLTDRHQQAIGWLDD